MPFCCEDCIHWEYDNTEVGGHCGIQSAACATDITNEVYLMHPARMPRRYIDKEDLPDVDKHWLEEGD